LSGSGVPTRSPTAAWQVVDGETVLLHADAGELLGLNKVGGRAWELADGARSIAEIAATISREFGADPDRVARDVEAFFAELQAAKLVAIK
jgi:hypothetical protein